LFFLLGYCEILEDASISPPNAKVVENDAGAQAGLLARNSQKPVSSEPQERDRELFSDADSFLRKLSPVGDREQSDTHEIDPPLPIRASPVKPRPNRFADIAADIAGTVEEDEHEEERIEVDFLAAAYIGRKKRLVVLSWLIMYGIFASTCLGKECD
jgi:hypothetical protein